MCSLWNVYCFINANNEHRSGVLIYAFMSRAVIHLRVPGFDSVQRQEILCITVLRTAVGTQYLPSGAIQSALLSGTGASVCSLRLKCDGTRAETRFVFRRNGRVQLNRQGRQFSQLLATKVCASAVVMLDTPCSELVWRVLVTHSIRQFPLHFPSHASPCAITFQRESSFLLLLLLLLFLLLFSSSFSSSSSSSSSSPSPSSYSTDIELPPCVSVCLVL